MADIPQLITQLTNKDDKIRTFAYTTLINLGGEAVDPLIAALNSPSDWQRKSVIGILAAIKDSRVIQPILQMLQDQDTYVRIIAAKALASLREPSAVQPIQQVIENERDSSARSSLLETVDALGQREWVIQYATRVLRDNTFTNADRQAIIQPIVELKDPTTADLMWEMFSKGELGVSSFALQALVAFKDQRALDALIAQLQEKEPGRRAIAAYHLGEFGNARALQPLKALLRDSAIAWNGDRPGEPSTSVAEVAREAVNKIQPLNAGRVVESVRSVMSESQPSNNDRVDNGENGALQKVQSATQIMKLLLIGLVALVLLSLLVF